ncbi:hypothetical protein HID58_022493, partial [Brassica napus]
TSRVAYGKREWTVQLAIWRVGQRHPSSPYGEWDGDVPARHTSSWMRSISSFSYLQSGNDGYPSSRFIARLPKLTIWRAGRGHPSSPYGEWDGDVPARHTSSGMRSRSSYGYLWVICMVEE